MEIAARGNDGQRKSFFFSARELSRSDRWDDPGEILDPLERKKVRHRKCSYMQCEPA
jgi:hypothetical protein